MPVISETSGSPLLKSDDEDYKIIGIHAKDIERVIKSRSVCATLKLRSEIFEYMKKNFTQLCYYYNCCKYQIMKMANAELNKTCYH